jgi:hypothetical protein
MTQSGEPAHESHPASRAAIAIAIAHARVNRTPRGSRGSGSRASHCHSEPGTPGPGESTGAAVTDWTSKGATFRTETLAIPVLPRLRCSSPARHAAIRQILLIYPAVHPGPRERKPGAPATPGRTRVGNRKHTTFPSRNVTESESR